jgi:cyclophilin family peptidyl-prolyl cis-trans isomerase
MMESPPSGAAVPWTVDKNDNAVQITNVIQLDFGIGKNEQGSIRIGLYGNSCPESVSQLLDFMENGIVTTSKLMLEDGFGVSASPVSFRMGGSLTTVYPQSRLEFGVPSQATSYAKSRGLNRIPKNFVPQPRPSGPRVNAISKEQSVRPHDVAGLLSIPKNGIGFGGTGLESDDEAFASAFEITAASVPAMDRESRKVIGQVMDQESMTFLARLASLATKKGLKGILPGQNAGPPLVKTSITFVSTIQPSS